MRITLSTAMRARDVSRPREDQLAEAAEREKAAARHGEAVPRGPAQRVEQPQPPGTSSPAEPAPASPRRRRRRHRDLGGA